MTAKNRITRALNHEEKRGGVTFFGDHAVVLIDKMPGMTSFDTLFAAKRIIRRKKAGHCGTLDMFASGLLILCTGGSTRLTRYFMERDKRYAAGIQLGARTDTDDLSGNVLEKRSFAGIGLDDIIKVVEQFKGEQMQLPPLYSALKIKGRRASDLARQGGDVKLEPRSITIRDITVKGYDAASGRIDLEVVCSKGTYIRSLARDIGAVFETGAHCSALRRLASGAFSVDNAVTLDELEVLASGGVCDKNFYLTPLEALSGFSRVILKTDALKKALNGAAFREDEVKSIEHGSGDEFIILSEDENLIAIANIEIDKWQIKYLNVFNSQYPNFSPEITLT